MNRFQVISKVNTVVLYQVGGSFNVQYERNGLLFVFTREETRDSVEEILSLDGLTVEPKGELGLFIPDQS
ncbi:MAG: hypothetical protein AAFZ17_20550 [Cyanobacteria bacterium J06650_10]